MPSSGASFHTSLVKTWNMKLSYSSSAEPRVTVKLLVLDAQLVVCCPWVVYIICLSKPFLSAHVLIRCCKSTVHHSTLL